MAWWVVFLMLAIPLIAVVGGVVIAIVAILRGRPGKGARLDEQEARMVQEIYQGLERMEKRIEALETILLDRERKDAK